MKALQSLIALGDPNAAVRDGQRLVGVKAVIAGSGSEAPAFDSDIGIGMHAIVRSIDGESSAADKQPAPGLETLHTGRILRVRCRSRTSRPRPAAHKAAPRIGAALCTVFTAAAGKDIEAAALDLHR